MRVSAVLHALYRSVAVPLLSTASAALQAVLLPVSLVAVLGPVPASPRLPLLQSPAAKASTRKTSILSRIGAHQFQSSTKIEALREEIWAMRQRDPSAKAIVFSQFTSMLDLITYRFEQVGS